MRARRSPPGCTSSMGEVRVRGFEAAATGRLTRNWQILAGYTFLDGEIVKASTFDATQGKVPANTPRNSATLWTTYNFTAEWEAGTGSRLPVEPVRQQHEHRLGRRLHPLGRHRRVPPAEVRPAPQSPQPDEQPELRPADPVGSRTLGAGHFSHRASHVHLQVLRRGGRPLVLVQIPGVLQEGELRSVRGKARGGRRRVGRRPRHGRPPRCAGEAQPADCRRRTDRARARRAHPRIARAQSALHQRGAAEPGLSARLQPVRRRERHAFRQPRGRRGAAAAGHGGEDPHRSFGHALHHRAGRVRRRRAADRRHLRRAARSSCRPETWCCIRPPASIASRR